MKKQINIKSQINNFQIGKYNKNNFGTQCDAGWYDWFCSDKALLGKTKKLYPKVSQIVEGALSRSNKTPEECYVWFKNNCPCYGDGKLYDDFRIADIKTGKVIYTITPRTPFGKAEVWGAENKFKEALAEGTWSEVKEFFNQKIN